MRGLRQGCAGLSLFAAACAVVVDRKLDDKPTRDELADAMRAPSADAASDASGQADASLADAAVVARDGAPELADPADGSAPQAPADASYADADVANPSARVKAKLCVGATHACGLMPSGKVTCWGDEGHDDGQTTLQARDPAERFVDLACGDYHTCGVTQSGTLRCVGRNRDAQSEPVASGDGFVQVAAGDAHSCALHRDGFVRCWGRGDSGQTTPPSTSLRAIAAGARVSCGIATSDERVVCWGNAGGGRSAPPSELRARSLELGGAQGCAIDTAQQLACWGLGSDAQPKLLKASAVSVGGADSVSERACALLEDGRATCWIDGQVRTLPGPFLALAVGPSATCLLPRTGELSCEAAEYDPILTRAPKPYPDEPRE